MGDRAIALSDAPHQEELLLSIRNPNPLRTEKIDPQHEIGIVQVDFGHVDFRIADNLAVDLQSEKAMSVRAQLLAVGTAHHHCRVARQYPFAHTQRQCSSRREHGELRAGIEQGTDPAAIELHRKIQAVARRSTRRDPSIWLGPGRRGNRAALLLIEGHTAPRQVEIDIDAAQGGGSEHPSSGPDRAFTISIGATRTLLRGTSTPPIVKLRNSNSPAGMSPVIPCICLPMTRACCAPIRCAAAGVNTVASAPVSRRRRTVALLAKTLTIGWLSSIATAASARRMVPQTPTPSAA